MDWVAVGLTLKLAAFTTLILAVVGLPLAYWLATTKRAWRPIVDAAVAVPLLLPPTVLGFYFLVATGPETVLGRLYASLFGGTVPFSFTGSPRTLYAGAIPILIAAIAFLTIRALMTHHLERVIAGIYPRGAEISAEVTDSGLTVTTPIVRTEIRARMISGVSVRANSVQLRLPGATGPAMVIPRELLDDDDVARLRSVIARTQGR